MSEMLKLYVRGGFEFVDEDTGFTTSDFGVSDNSLNDMEYTSLPPHHMVNQLKVKRKSVSVSKSSLRLKTATVPIRGTSPIR